jgi:hypothetical protein
MALLDAHFVRRSARSVRRTHNADTLTQDAGLAPSQRQPCRPHLVGEFTGPHRVEATMQQLSELGELGVNQIGSTSTKAFFSDLQLL